jgi:hypothetical protein
MRYLSIAALVVIAAPVAAQSASHLGAAHELIALTHQAEANRESDSAYVDWLLTRSPELKSYTDIVRAYADAVYDWSAIEPALAQNLTLMLTEAELREVGRFLRTPAGRKWTGGSLERRRTSSMLLDRRFEAGEGEFRRRLEARAKELRRPVPLVGQLIPS